MRSPLYVTLAAAALFSCSTTAVEAPAGPSIRGLIITMDYEEAVRLSAERVASSPSRTNLHEQKLATIAWLLDQGRKLTFADKDMEALLTFEQALVLEPTSVGALTWIGKTRGKMANSSFELAMELHANEDYSGALEFYAEALSMNPSHDGALRGSELAKKQSGQRKDRQRRDAQSACWGWCKGCSRSDERAIAHGSSDSRAVRIDATRQQCVCTARNRVSKSRACRLLVSYIPLANFSAPGARRTLTAFTGPASKYLTLKVPTSHQFNPECSN